MERLSRRIFKSGGKAKKMWIPFLCHNALEGLLQEGQRGA